MSLAAPWSDVSLTARDVCCCFQRGSDGAGLDGPLGSCGRFRFRSLDSLPGVLLVGEGSRSLGLMFVFLDIVRS